MVPGADQKPGKMTWVLLKKRPQKCFGLCLTGLQHKAAEGGTWPIGKWCQNPTCVTLTGLCILL